MKQTKDATTIIIRFPGVETIVAAVARHMLRHGLTPQDVLAAHDQWLAARMAEMEPAGDEAVMPRRSRSISTGARRHLSRDSRHRAGDHAQIPRACPVCGGAVELLQLCHISSPTWRTQLACMADGCAWHGKSKLPIDALIAAGAKNIKHNVSEG